MSGSVACHETEEGNSTPMKVHGKSGEMEAFLSGEVGYPGRGKSRNRGGFWYGKSARNLCLSTGGIGGVLILLGVVVLLAGSGMLRSKILSSMALTPGSERFESWLRPPVEPHLWAYAFNLTNPEEVLEGGKPVVEEVGPFVYKSSTLKDSDDNLKWSSEDQIIDYRPRKVYTFVPGLSKIKDPQNTFVTLPNVPFWTGLNRIKSKGSVGRDLGVQTITSVKGTSTRPFVNVSLAGFLWGYLVDDEIPCLKGGYPSECGGEDSAFSLDSDSDWGFDFDKKRRKRSVPDGDEKSDWDHLVKPRAEYVDCKCEWGLFRDRNITMRKPLEIFSGVSDLADKGKVISFDGKTEFHWWKKGSKCDQVRGQDSSTLPPSITPDMKLEMFIALMCRPIDLTYEKSTTHDGILAHRFIPPLNALGAHDDSDESRRNPDNECYCLKDEQFECYKSGVYNLQPCKRDTGAPLALSYPHFYQADPSFREAVGGLEPDKEKHEFYVDVVPEFGFPLAIRPRFQLNILIGDTEFYAPTSKVKKTLLPFLWAQDGFDKPSEEMASAIRFGLEAPERLPTLIAIVCFLLGAALLLVTLSYFLYLRKVNSSDHIAPK